MPLRAGSYAVSYFRGVIRMDSFPWYRCTHEHPTAAEARDCAFSAQPELSKRDHAKPDAPLPVSWIVYADADR